MPVIQTLVSPLSVLSDTDSVVTLSAIPVANVVAHNSIYNHFYNPNYKFAGIKNGIDIYEYDSGIGSGAWPRYQVNVNMRDNFFDKFYKHSEILHLLKVVNDKVVILSSADAQQNDISKDTYDIVRQKKEYVKYNILTLSKNRKLLDMICYKNKLKNYDLPHSKHAVLHEQIKYVIKKLKEMRDFK